MIIVKDIPNTKNIIKQDDGYYIRKYLNGKHTYLGYGSTLIIALMRLDWCKSNDWKPFRPEKTYIQKRDDCGLYTIRKWIDNEFQYLGSFKTLEDAQKEVELMKKCDWDFESLCNLDERTNGKTIFLGREMYG